MTYHNEDVRYQNAVRVAVVLTYDVAKQLELELVQQQVVLDELAEPFEHAFAVLVEKFPVQAASLHVIV